MRAVVLVLATAAVATSCGGDGGEPLSQAEFERQANQICADLGDALDAMGEVESAEELQQQLDEGEERFQAALDDLRELEPPEEHAENFDRFLASGDELIDVIRDLREAARDEDVVQLQRIGERGDEIDTESDRIATELGLEECAND